MLDEEMRQGAFVILIHEAALEIIHPTEGQGYDA